MARVPADRATLFVGAALAAVTAAAWMAFLAQASASPGRMAMDAMFSDGPDLASAAGFVGAWVVMKAATVLPSVAPLVLLYRVAGADGRAVKAAPLVAGYLLAWVEFGAVVYAAQQTLGVLIHTSPAFGNPRPYAVAGIPDRNR